MEKFNQIDVLHAKYKNLNPRDVIAEHLKSITDHSERKAALDDIKNPPERMSLGYQKVGETLYGNGLGIDSVSDVYHRSNVVRELESSKNPKYIEGIKELYEETFMI